MSSKNKKFGPPWPGRQLLSYRCLHKSKNCVGLRGDWQLVTLRVFNYFSRPKIRRKDVNEPLVVLQKHSTTTSKFCQTELIDLIA